MLSFRTWLTEGAEVVGLGSHFFPQRVQPGQLMKFQDVLKYSKTKGYFMDVTGKEVVSQTGQEKREVKLNPKDIGKFNDNNGVLAVVDENGHVWVTRKVHPEDTNFFDMLKRGGYRYDSLAVPLSNQERIIDNGRASKPVWPHELEKAQEQNPYDRQRAYSNYLNFQRKLNRRTFE